MTRAQRAKKLREQLLRGPAFSPFDMSEEAIAAATRLYKLWSESWILPEIDALIPELRKKP